MSVARWISCGLLVVALAAGTLSDVPVVHPPMMLGGYRVLAVDFHVHPFPLSWSTLAPWDLVLEARRQDLDAVAIAGHNHVWVGQAARWFSKLVGGPTVISSEEIHPPSGHIVALGIEHTVDWRLGAERAIDEVHRQGGVAIAAHPVKASWPVWTDAAVRKLDGAEVVQPIVYLRKDAALEMLEFYRRAHVTAIGSSDYHGLGPLGLCRTFVFARDDSQASILEAVRAGRTVVYGSEGVYGDPELIRLADDAMLLKSREVALASGAVRLSAVCGILGLLLSLFSRGRRRRPDGAMSN